MDVTFVRWIAKHGLTPVQWQAMTQFQQAAFVRNCKACSSEVRSILDKIPDWEIANHREMS